MTAEGPARPGDPAEAMAVLAELMRLRDAGLYVGANETWDRARRALVDGAVTPAGDAETREEYAVWVGDPNKTWSQPHPWPTARDAWNAEGSRTYGSRVPVLYRRTRTTTVTTSPWIEVPR